MNQPRMTDSGFVPAVELEVYEKVVADSEINSGSSEGDRQETKTNTGLPAVVIAAQFANSGSGSTNLEIKPVDSEVKPVVELAAKPVVSAVKQTAKNVFPRARVSSDEIDGMLSVLGDYVESIEKSVYDTRFDVEERKKLRFGKFEDKSDACFDVGTRILISESKGLAEKLGSICKSGGQAVMYERLRDRLAGINVFNEAYEDMLSASNRIFKNGEKLADYINPMDMRNGVNARYIGDKVPNRLKLWAKVCALHRMKYLSENEPMSEYADSFEKITSSHREAWYGRVLQSLEEELVELDDWELIGKFKNIVGRLPEKKKDSRLRQESVKSGLRLEAMRSEPRSGWFGKVLKTAAAIGLGVLGTLGYQHYSAQKNAKIEAPAVVERAEQKSQPILSGGYVIGFDRYDKYSGNDSLELGLRKELKREDYSNLEQLTLW